MRLPDRPDADAGGGHLIASSLSNRLCYRLGKRCGLWRKPEKPPRIGAAARGSYLAYRSSSLFQEMTVTILTGARVEASAAMLER